MQEYTDLLLSKLKTLAPHHVFSNALSAHLKELKKTMKKNTALIVINFAKNWSFRIQDEAQGYHWIHQSCTNDLVICYYKFSGDELKHASLCFLSEELQHDSIIVYQI